MKLAQVVATLVQFFLPRRHLKMIFSYRISPYSVPYIVKRNLRLDEINPADDFEINSHFRHLVCKRNLP